jgi:hypothetical protein
VKIRDIGFVLSTRLVFRQIQNKFRNLVATLLVQLISLNIFQTLAKIFPKKSPSIFALDLHTSVTRDVQNPLIKSGFYVRRWSISGSASLFKEPNLRISYINNSNWMKIDSARVNMFNHRYKNFLYNRDAFLVSYTFSFLDLFKSIERPIFAVNATRYESPYTHSLGEFKSLNATIKNLSDSGLLHIVSNNRGDRDYLRQFSGVDSKYIPNLCDYTTPISGEDESWVVLSRNIDLSRKIASQSNHLVSQYDKYPTGFTFKEFARNRGVVLIPYNISTMRLFELTSAGFPVRIPTDRLLREIWHLPGVLSELSWVQVSGRECPDWLKETPADPNWIGFYPWWLERADWNNFEMFPNVSRFDSFDELLVEPNIDFTKKIDLRNNLIRDEWTKYTDNFYEICKNLA